MRIPGPTRTIAALATHPASLYVDWDTVDDDLLKEVNPEGKPVSNLIVTSKDDVWATLLNLLNGGIIDRGILVSLNDVTIEGDVPE